MAVSISQQPADVSASTGATVHFTVVGGGGNPKLFAWGTAGGGVLPAGALLSYIPAPGDPGKTNLIGGYVPLPDGVLVRGSACRLTIPNAQSADAGGYQCEIAVALEGQLLSDVATLTVLPPDTTGGTPATGGDPAITSQPPDTIVAVGSPCTLPITATGTAPLAYAWFQHTASGDVALADGASYSGTATDTLTIATVGGGGVYLCKVTGPNGTAVSRLIVVSGVEGAAPAGPVLPGGISDPVYSGAASAFAAFFGGTFNSAGVYPDGDFNEAQPDGMMWPEFPFAGEGDIATVVCKQRYMQFAYRFTPTALGTPCSFNNALLLLDEDDFKAVGGGVVSWVRTFATLPANRDTFESTSYGFQFLISGGETIKLGETNFEVTSRVRREYFHVKDRANWPTKLAPRLLQLADKSFFKRGEGTLTVDSTYGAFLVSPDGEILAEDSKERMWRYPFMERSSRYIAAPTLAFWGDAINVPVPASAG